MQCRQLAAGLILCFLVVCHPKVAKAQFPNFFRPQQNGFARQAPRSGSFSKVNNNAYERQIDLGPVDLTRGVSNTRAVTSNNGGFRNGGTTSIADRNAVSRGINLGGLDIGSTLSRTQTRTNGKVSRAFGHDLNVGNLGIGTSLSRDNLRRGFGLQRDDDGKLSLGLGFLNIGLSRNAQQEKAALSQAQVSAQGENAQAKANSQVQTQQQNYGNVAVKETRTNTNAVGRSQFGQTQTNFFGGRNFFGGSNFARGRRSPARATRKRYRQAAFGRPKRHTEVNSFEYPYDSSDHEHLRPRRRPKVPGQQAAGANTHSNNRYDQNGYSQDNVLSYIASDVSRVQVSSANIAQSISQSQSLNFDPNQQQATPSNAVAAHTIKSNFECLDSESGSIVSKNDLFANSKNTGSTNAGVFQHGDHQESQSKVKSQSMYQSVHEQTAGKLTGSQSSSVSGPIDYVRDSASSNASANSLYGGNASASPASLASNGISNAYIKTFANGGGFGGFRRREQKLSYRIDNRYPRPTILTHLPYNFSQLDKQQPPEATELLDLNRPIYSNASARQTVGLQYDPNYPSPEPRTINTIVDFVTNLFVGCVTPCTLAAYFNNRCCNITVPARPLTLACCQGHQYPLPYSPRPYYPSQHYPINCCSNCNMFSYYGPPPCYRYSNGGYYGGIGSGTAGGAGLSFGAGTPFGNAGVSLSVPPFYG